MSKEKFINDCKAVLEELEGSYNDYDYATIKASTFANYEDSLDKAKAFALEYPFFEEFTHIEQFGGEGQGDTYYVVWKVTHPEFGEIFLQHDGWYASYQGPEFSDIRQVVPEQQTITVFKSA